VDPGEGLRGFEELRNFILFAKYNENHQVKDD
jgi:hypothetical protein